MSILKKPRNSLKVLERDKNLFALLLLTMGVVLLGAPMLTGALNAVGKPREAVSQPLATKQKVLRENQ